VDTQVEQKNDGDTTMTPAFVAESRKVHFYFVPININDNPPSCPTGPKDWQKFYDNNKISSRSNRMKRARQDENNEEQQQGMNRPWRNIATPRATAKNARNGIDHQPTVTPASAGILFSPPTTEAVATASTSSSAAAGATATHASGSTPAAAAPPPLPPLPAAARIGAMVKMTQKMEK
jgi:hypothetical protein